MTFIQKIAVFFGSLGVFFAGVASLIFSAAYVGVIPKIEEASNERATIAPACTDPLPKPSHDFQLVQLGEMRRDHFLLDKDTGRVWNRICAGKLSDNGAGCDGALEWQEMYVEEASTSQDSIARFSHDRYIQELLASPEPKKPIASTKK